jgi:membrane protein DedA with SNARE-associated domain
MDRIYVVLDYISKYGLIFLFVIVFLEYLSIPGIPSGVIMPAGGVLVAYGDYSFMVVFLLSMIAGILGSLILYFIGYYIGNSALDWVYNKFYKSRTSIDKVLSYFDKFGQRGIFICRLFPFARTWVSLIAGTVRSNIRTFILYSVLGMSIWNSLFITIGYVAAKFFIN